MKAETHFTGKPCLRGHITNRYVIGNHCVECVRTRYNPDPKIFDRHKRKSEILEVALELASKPGGFVTLTRRQIADRVGCSPALVSLRLGSMNLVRKAVANAAIKQQLTAIVIQLSATKYWSRVPHELRVKSLLG